MKLLVSACCTLFSVSAWANVACPTQFETLPLHPSASYCNKFDGGSPATLSYHANTNISQTIEFYTEKLGQPSSAEVTLGRHVLQFNQGEQILVFSVDGSGTQVDMLIKLPS